MFCGLIFGCETSLHSWYISHCMCCHVWFVTNLRKAVAEHSTRAMACSSLSWKRLCLVCFLGNPAHREWLESCSILSYFGEKLAQGWNWFFLIYLVNRIHSQSHLARGCSLLEIVKLLTRSLCLSWVSTQRVPLLLGKLGSLSFKECPLLRCLTG